MRLVCEVPFRRDLQVAGQCMLLRIYSVRTYFSPMHFRGPKEKGVNASFSGVRSSTNHLSGINLSA